MLKIHEPCEEQEEEEEEDESDKHIKARDLKILVLKNELAMLKYEAVQSI